MSYMKGLFCQEGRAASNSNLGVRHRMLMLLSLASVVSPTGASWCLLGGRVAWCHPQQPLRGFKVSPRLRKIDVSLPQMNGVCLSVPETVTDEDGPPLIHFVHSEASLASRGLCGQGPRPCSLQRSGDPYREAVFPSPDVCG